MILSYAQRAIAKYLSRNSVFLLKVKLFKLLLLNKNWKIQEETEEIDWVVHAEAAVT